MQQEKALPVPLTGEEVQKAILARVQEALQKSCHMKFDNAYTSFAGSITIRLELSDYGRPVMDNHNVDIPLTGELGPELSIETAEIKLEPKPPNQVRIESDQAVPVRTVVDGKGVTKHVKYAARKAKVLGE